MPSMIACAHGFNHCRMRDALISNIMTKNECPPSSEIETRDYVIKCTKTKELQRKCVIELMKDLLKNKEESLSCNDVLEMMEDSMV